MVVERLMPLPLSDSTYDTSGLPASLPVTQDQLPTSQPTMAQRVVDTLLGTNGQERYQLWPERVVRDALSAPHDVLNSKTPMTSDQMIKPALDVSALAGTGGLGGAEATLGSGPFLRPALKYEGKIYKAPVKDASNPLFMGAEHSDAIPKELLPEFTRQAMNGEDISNFNFGFINHKGQFLDREKALDYGIKEGLLSPHDAKFGALTSTMMADSSKEAAAINAYKTGEKYHQVIPEIKDINVKDLLRRDAGEVANISKDQAENYKPYLNEPIEVSLFNDGSLKINDGHHRVAAAKILGIDKLPVKLQAINAKGENIQELIGKKK